AGGFPRSQGGCRAGPAQRHAADVPSQRLPPVHRQLGGDGGLADPVAASRRGKRPRGRRDAAAAAGVAGLPRRASPVAQPRSRRLAGSVPADRVRARRPDAALLHHADEPGQPARHHDAGAPHRVLLPSGRGNRGRLPAPARGRLKRRRISAATSRCRPHEAPLPFPGRVNLPIPPGSKEAAMPRTVLPAAVLAGRLALGAASAGAQSLTHVPAAYPKTPGVVAQTVLSVGVEQVLGGTGSMLLENPQSPAKYYGYNDDKPNLVPIIGVTPAVEAHKTEPDKNTYLVLRSQRGA